MLRVIGSSICICIVCPRSFKVARRGSMDSTYLPRTTTGSDDSPIVIMWSCTQPLHEGVPAHPNPFVPCVRASNSNHGERAAAGNSDRDFSTPYEQSTKRELVLFLSIYRSPRQHVPSKRLCFSGCHLCINIFLCLFPQVLAFNV